MMFCFRMVLNINYIFKLQNSFNFYNLTSLKFIQLAEAAVARRSPPLHIKKLYLLGALLVTEQQGSCTTNKLTSDPLLAVDNAWHGAEAFHFLMLTERQLYQGIISVFIALLLNIHITLL
jgi:hypothetical protein